MTGVSKVVAQHLNVMSQMCEELQPKVDGEVHQDLNANLEETESQLLVSPLDKPPLSFATATLKRLKRTFRYPQFPNPPCCYPPWTNPL